TAGAEGSFRLRVAGNVDPSLHELLGSFDRVEVHGVLEREELDHVLDRVDVGLMPAVWEETLGYTGLEMVAKGIPLIANPLGGVVEYAREGQTAWLNHSCTGQGMADLMLNLIREPEHVLDMHRRTVAAREEIITPWARHVDAIEDIYRQLVLEER